MTQISEANSDRFSTVIHWQLDHCSINLAAVSSGCRPKDVPCGIKIADVGAVLY